MCSRLNYSGRSWDMNMLCVFFFFPVLFWVVVGLCFVALFVVFFLFGWFFAGLYCLVSHSGYWNQT